MKKIVFALAMMATSAVFADAAATAAAPAATAPASQPSLSLKERVSYVIGMQIGNTIKRQNIEIDPAQFQAGVQDGSEGKAPKLTQEEIAATMQEFQKVMMAKQAEAQAKAGAENQIKGETFLANNAKKDGVKVLPSGLQYKIIKTGAGKQPKATDTVAAAYTGKLVDGKVFDASPEGKPVEFPVNQVIAGWTEALQLMHEGDKWELYIPAKLAYGESGAGGAIGPNETLVFEVELVKIKDAPKEAAK